MFERFTDRARRIIVVAQEEATRLGANHIDVDSILLGLIEEGEGIGARVLSLFGVEEEEFRKLAAERYVGATKMGGHKPFAPNAKKVMELALREALQLGHNYIGTEHILLAVCRVDDPFVGAYFADHDVTLADARKHVVAILEASAKSIKAEEAPEIPTVKAVRTPRSPRTVFTKTTVEGNRTETIKNLERREIGESIENLFFPAQGLAPERITFTYDGYSVTWSWEWKD